MERSFWGPSTWTMIHVFAWINRNNMLCFKEFMYNLPYLLPCNQCCAHLSENLQFMETNYPMGAFNTHETSLYDWSYILHDIVNEQLHKNYIIAGKNGTTLFSTSPQLQLIKLDHWNIANTASEWQPHFWRMLHSFAASYKPEHDFYFKRFITLLAQLVPASFRDSFMHALQVLPLGEKQLVNSTNVFLWSYIIHDTIDRKTLPPYETMKKQYFDDKVCHACSSNT